MSKKGTLLKRRTRPPVFKAPLLRGRKLVEMMKVQWLKQNPGCRFKYIKLATSLPMLNSDDTVNLSAAYLSGLYRNDYAPIREKAVVIAAYLQIPLESIAVSNYNPRTAPKEQKLSRLKTKPQPVANPFCKLANRFISGNPNINTQSIGVGYVN